jgi:chemotaxis protein MotB
MLRNEDISEDRVVVEGLADTRPLVENNSPQNRAKNRRVELILTRGLDDEIRDLKDLQLE